METQARGSFLFVLHTHLPYVITHGKWPHGSDWLNEAAAETYIPILNMLGELVDEGYHPKLSIGISPVLAEQLADPVFKEGFVYYLDEKISAAKKDTDYFCKNGDEHLNTTAKFWDEWYTSRKHDFVDKYDYNLIAGFRKFSDIGVIDIITCAATHGYFPLLSQDSSIDAQVKIAIETHKRHFGVKPRGIWLPECAYRPRYRWKPPVKVQGLETEYERKGVEELLSENGIEYFVIDSAMLLGGKPIGLYLDRFGGLKQLWEQYEKSASIRQEEFKKSVYDLYLVDSPGSKRLPSVAIFTRDPKTALQVWSGDYGYPGDGQYLEFHKKHHLSGHRYWRVTHSDADLADKLKYEPDKIEERLESHSSHFVHLVNKSLKEHYNTTKTHGVLTAPFDTELFGHWWFEGPRFLKKVLMKIEQSNFVKLSSASAEIDIRKPNKVIQLPEGSWGEGGHHFIWFNSTTEWTWKKIYEDELIMQELAEKYSDTKDEKIRFLLSQAARELLILQASDWQFLISTQSARRYAEERFTNHHSDFIRLVSTANTYANTGVLSDVDWEYANECLERNLLFPEIDLKFWKK
ncbi:MAG: DUF1957 domain-containing protein [Bacteroidota bacterium]|nr:DUF1957 domain-containing protein [Bacteroidota bacterium]